MPLSDKDLLDEDIIRIDGVFSSLEMYKLESSEMSCLKAVILYKPGWSMITNVTSQCK